MSVYEKKEQETSADTQRHCRHREPPGLSDVDTQRTTSSGLSCVSMKSNNSMNKPPELSDGPAVTSTLVSRTSPSNVPRTFQDGHDVEFFKGLGDVI
ncbi:ATP synthase subunit beta [Labeo rohita]|uniref:ATP synthase subunit beta n=1 Tax=Labeo rohita TaxID=84645 RepID=A0ABQ8L1E5_LABRO|nr:ATP synthase subunit beta [Labeo rohita]